MLDTLKLASRLEAAGFTHEQATGQAAALGEFLDQSAITKSDLDLAIERLRSDLTMRMLGVGVAQAVIVAILLKYLR